MLINLLRQGDHHIMRFFVFAVILSCAIKAHTTASSTTRIPEPTTTSSTAIATGCGNSVADIIFLADTSGSIDRDEFKEQILFIQRMVINFTISPNDIQVGIVTFSNAAKNEFTLNKYATKSGVLSGIGGIIQRTGETHTSKALAFVRTDAFAVTNGDRPNATNILIVITDGHSTATYEPHGEAKLLKDARVKIIAIGVGGEVKTSELVAMASSPRHVFEVTDFTALQTIMSEVQTIRCEVDGGWTDWSPWVCDVTCGDGTATRGRSCTNPVPQYGGLDCVGDYYETRICDAGGCAVDGGWSDWSTWVCDVSCGSGTETRGRTCTNPVPQHGGADCEGNGSENRACDPGPCPIDGDWATWSEWFCIVTCGNETSVRVRTCTDPPPQYGGAGCVGDDIGIDQCYAGACPVDGGWSDWSTWVCDVSCGSGTETRGRTCTNPVPQHGGAECEGNDSENRACDPGPCLINGGWTAWKPWVCGVTCGTGTYIRGRTCTNPIPQFGGTVCAGPANQTRTCHAGPCPVNGGWTAWSPWICGVTCGTGTANHGRTCTNPMPQFGGTVCVGPANQTRTCHARPCPVNGGWTAWSPWICGVTCGTGTANHGRTCTNPMPQFGGTACVGPANQTRTCHARPCPVDGGWSDWSTWVCDVSCGSGTETRGRTCTNPVPQHGGADCEGNDSENRACDPGPCPIHGGWTEWTSWDCEVTCGPGVAARGRSCTNPEPQHGGAECVGDDTETKMCYPGPCPVHGGWTEWTSWDCEVTCGPGVAARGRSCTNPEPQHGGAECVGDDTETKMCYPGPCPVVGGWTEWTSWDCEVTCGPGIAARGRSCTDPVPLYGGAVCVGGDTETRKFERDPCPINGGWTDWSPWVCDVTCDNGTATHGRSCANPVPQHGGLDCVGDDTETQACYEGGCPVYGGWTEWTSWDCEVTCGLGVAARDRSCTNPEPQHGGAECVGDDTETKMCYPGPCPVHGGWTEWTSWDCEVMCGPGVTARGRSCTNPEPQHGGAECVGDDTETKTCYQGPCPVDGGWTEWTLWDCEVTCGPGIAARGRSCTDPVPLYGGAVCVGGGTETRKCERDPCPNREWTSWTSWHCGVTCGFGTAVRDRICTDPEPRYGEADCAGAATETRACYEGKCSAVLECPMCGDHEYCHNSECVCDLGYTEVNGICVSAGVLECPECDSNKHCDNFKCVCDSGYQKFLGVCYYMPCFVCGAHKHCANFECVCNAGYKDYEGTCLPLSCYPWC